MLICIGTISILNWTGSLQSANLHTPENAVLGQSSVLTCEVHTSLPVTTSLLSVQWMHRGNMVINTSSGFVLKQGSTSIYVTELTLNETTVEQSGLYSCLVSLDTDRQQQTAEGNLTVSCKQHIPDRVTHLYYMQNLQFLMWMFSLLHLMGSPHNLYWETTLD